MNAFAIDTEQDVYVEFEKAADRHTDARAEELRLEDERMAAKHAAILRMLQVPNETTGKAHSATSATEFVTLDPGYRDYLKRSREAVVMSMVTQTEREIRYARMMAHAMGGVK